MHLAAIALVSLRAFVLAETPVCPKCGTTKKSGKLSCCARGGSWYKKCGNPGDSNFAHTWGEGNQACNGKATICFVDINVSQMMVTTAVG